MRYLKQFSEWRDNQSALIAKKVGKLKYRTQLLAQTKNDKDRRLRSHMTAQRNLEQQYARQDVVVADLKKNGEALRSHLAKKQSEANDLRNRVAALIAQEQAAAEARRREEERREQARIAEKERQERLRAEAEAKEKAEEVRRQELAEALKPKKEDKESPKKEKPKKDKKAEKPKKSSGGDYAEARKRRPRSSAEKSSAPAKDAAKSHKAEKAKAADYGNFEAAKGNLPRPVSGAFRVTSPFGRHPLPDPPDVMYDNPGIDAEVSQGGVGAGRLLRSCQRRVYASGLQYGGHSQSRRLLYDLRQHCFFGGEGRRHGEAGTGPWQACQRPRPARPFLDTF